MSASLACAVPISRMRPDGDRQAKFLGWVSEWFWTSCPRRCISRTIDGYAAALAPIQKKLACTPQLSSRSRTRGVAIGCGPSSNVSATCRCRTAGAGNRTTLRPSSVLRGIKPNAVSAAWFAANAPANQGQLPGHVPSPANANRCKLIEDPISGDGDQRVKMRATTHRG